MPIGEQHENQRKTLSHSLGDNKQFSSAASKLREHGIGVPQPRMRPVEQTYAAQGKEEKNVEKSSTHGHGDKVHQAAASDPAFMEQIKTAAREVATAKVHEEMSAIRAREPHVTAVPVATLERIVEVSVTAALHNVNTGFARAVVHEYAEATKKGGILRKNTLNKIEDAAWTGLGVGVGVAAGALAAAAARKVFNLP